jgi:hypothetical protein
MSELKCTYFDHVAPELYAWLDQNLETHTIRDRYGDSHGLIEVVPAEAVLALLAGKVLCDAEPFGYFKPEPFGWTDCAETDEGARPLYAAADMGKEGGK